MNITITTFTNPFSFYFLFDTYGEHNTFKFENQTNSNFLNCTKISELNHGQYVAVMWNNKWTRGVVSMENQFLIWLIDYGIFLRPDEKTVFIDLPLEYRRLPSKVIEASIHGVVPIDKVLTEDCQIKNDISTSWTQGCIEKAQDLIKSASRTYFQPIALLTTTHNHVLIGDLLLEIPGKGLVNIIDELEKWPVFLERNKETYISNLKLYVSRRKHRLCFLKPDISRYSIPEITLQIDLKEYEDIIANSPKHTFESIEDGSTVVEQMESKDKSAYKITASDIEKYSNSYVTLNGREYNVLSVLINKARDLSICERYKNHDGMSVGRGTSSRPSHNFL